MHRTLIGNLLASEAWLAPGLKRKPVSGQLTFVCALPLYHVFAFIVCGLLAMRTGGVNILIPNPRDIGGTTTTCARRWRVTDPRRMPVEDPRVRWEESLSPYRKVATVRIKPQKFDTPAQQTFAEDLSCTPWHCIPEHRPLGGVNRCRESVYREISNFRHRAKDYVSELGQIDQELEAELAA